MTALMPRQAILKQKIHETADTCSLKFTITDDEDFSFKPGQFNMLGLPGFGEAPISFSSLMIGKKSFLHTIRLAGNVTRAICRMKIGDQLQIRGPYGNGWPLEAAHGKNVIIVAGGIGMAPLRAVVYHLLQNRDKFKNLFLFCGARVENDILYREEMKMWSESEKIAVLLSVDEEPKKRTFVTHVGVVISLFDRVDLPSLAESVTFTCGPELMMRFVARRFILDGQNPNDIFVSLERRMKCGIAHCGHCQIGAKYVCKDGPVFSYADIRRFADTLL